MSDVFDAARASEGKDRDWRLSQDEVERAGAYIAARERQEDLRVSCGEELSETEAWLRSTSLLAVPRTRRKRALALLNPSVASADEQAGEIEERERKKWASRWAEFLIMCDAPSARKVALAENRRNLLMRVVGRRRGSALRQRFKTMQSISRWCEKTMRCKTPIDVNHFLEYLEILAEETCGRTVPRNQLATLSLYEYLAGIADEDKI